MYRERMSGADPQGSAQSAMAASSGAETTFELIDSPTANRPHPKTPIELLAAIAPTGPKFDLTDFACRSGSRARPAHQIGLLPMPWIAAILRAWPCDGRLLQQRLNKLARIETNRRGYVQKLQHIKTPIPTLVFRHVGWRFTEALRHYRLGQTSRLPPRFEQFTQLFVAGRMDGLWQLGKPESVGLPIKIVLDDSPKMGENGEAEIHPLNTLRGTSGGKVMINLKILAVGLAAACLPGCAVQRAVVANDAQEKMVGLTKEQVFACMGPPATKAAEGVTEVWSYNSGNDRTTVSTFGRSTTNVSISGGSGNASTLSTGVGISSRRYCNMSVVMADGRVNRVNYSGPTGGLLTGGEQCAFSVQNCSQMVAR
jgi:hypothetical protein